MKTITKIALIIVGLFVFAIGCELGGNGIAMVISLLGGMIMLAGILPIIDKETFSAVKKN